MQTVWTDDRVALLRELWPHETTAAIAKRLGRGFTRNAVIAKAYRLKLRRISNAERQRRARVGLGLSLRASVARL